MKGAVKENVGKYVRDMREAIWGGPDGWHQGAGLGEKRDQKRGSGHLEKGKHNTVSHC